MLYQIVRQGQAFGMFEWNQIVQGLLNGHFFPNDQLLHPATMQWVALFSLPELQGIMQQLQAQAVFTNIRSNEMHYVVYQNGQANQPYSFSFFVQLLQNGSIHPDQSVRRVGEQNWTTFAALPEFAPYLPSQSHQNTAQPVPEPAPQRTRQLTTQSCRMCNGSGSIGRCGSCSGAGRNIPHLSISDYTGNDELDDFIKRNANRDCSSCSGTGKLKCSRCGGSGKVTELV